jgi:hypothetical protein
VTFPLFDNYTTFDFELPVQAGNGGIVFLDDAIMVQTPGDTVLSFSTVLEGGNHKLEIYTA